MEKVQYNDKPVKQMLYPAILFMLFGMFVGVFLAFNAFVFPNFLSGEYIQFGRLRPVHVGEVALLWLFAGGMGLFYYMVPRLCGCRIWSVRLANITNALFWVSLIAGIFSFPFGTNWGYEYAELPMTLWGWFPVKGLFTLSWVLFTINIFMTIANRKYKKMYVSLWYIMGTLLWTATIYVIGNFGILAVPGGISRINVSYFYVHNLVGLIFTPMGVACAYYFVPKLANTPLYSHRLSMIGFWSIAFIYAWVGSHHIIHGPVSQWLQTTSIVFSLWLIIPVWTVVANLFITMKGRWKAYTNNPPLRFLMMGNLFYLLVAFQGSTQALRNLNEIISKTDWVVGHAHMALFGTFTFFAIGGVYHAVSVITKKPIWSKALADWHFSLSLLGGMVFFLSLMLGGFFQGLSWASWAEGSSYSAFHEQITKLPFLETIVHMRVWWTLRGIGGIIILIGAFLFVLNILNTVILPSRGKKGLETIAKEDLSYAETR